MSALFVWLFDILDAGVSVHFAQGMDGGRQRFFHTGKKRLCLQNGQGVRYRGGVGQGGWIVWVLFVVFVFLNINHGATISVDQTDLGRLDGAC